MSNLEFSKNQKLAIYALIGLSLIGLSISLRNNMMASKNDVVLREPGNGMRTRMITSDSDPMPGSNSSSGKVMFHIVGCVKAPGVYSLPKGNRIVDALRAAKGSTAEADLQAMNLAAKIEDGSKICVPSVNGVPNMGIAAGHSTTSIHPVSKTTASSSNKLTTPGQGTVNINSDDVSGLQRLPGVGPTTAQKIVEYRTQIGRFTSADQLLDVKGIGPKKYEKMRPFLNL